MDDSYPNCRCLGNYNLALRESLEGYKFCCIATFIIPSGYVYFTNEEGEIVSNKIRYTGKYIKL